MTGTVRAGDPGLTGALELGWRIAHLYALADDISGPPSGDTLLPMHDSLGPEDQLEVQVRAAAGDALRAGIGQSAGALQALVPDARAAAASSACVERFRTELESCHIELDKQLWARSEAQAKAYELGNGLSDTYNRIRRSYRDDTPTDVAGEWATVFGEERVKRLERLLHDLQAGLDPRAVTVVSDHLHAWKERVSKWEFGQAPGLKPAAEDVQTHLREQTIIWRQLLAGDKEPEAFLDRGHRTRLRGSLTRLMWKRYLPWLPALAGGVVAVVLAATHFDEVTRWYQHNPALATLITGVAGALGLTRASVGLAIRSRMVAWTELMWNQALAQRITDATLVVDVLLPPRSHRIVAAIHNVPARSHSIASHAQKSPSIEAPDPRPAVSTYNTISRSEHSLS